jgi:two-component system, NtrC family, sensor histidine kinase HydH
MLRQGTKRHFWILSFLVAILTILHYMSARIAGGEYHLEIVFQRLYFLPIVLSCLWFDLKGGLTTFLAVFLLLTPHLVRHWSGLSAGDLNRIMQIVVYFVIAVVLGKVVSLQKKEQMRASQSENLAAIGRSLSTVAHDMKTPLIAIGGFAHLVKKHLAGENPDCSKLDIIISETSRLEGMVKDMLDFSRPLKLDRAEVDFSRILRECAAIVEESARNQGVVLQVDSIEHFPPVYLDPERIRQALINMLTNAVQASPEGEKVIAHYYRKGRNFSLEVVDCGCGIPFEKRKEIFSPFVTTKKNGTGLGLPIVKKIVDAHGGYIEIIDNPCKGITFRMTLPGTVREGLLAEIHRNRPPRRMSPMESSGI